MVDLKHVDHAADRFSGYLRGLFDVELVPRPRDFVFCMSSGATSPDTELLKKRLADDDRPDAVFVLQDMMVPAIVDAIFEAGLRIPEDVAVASFGGEIPIAIDEVGLTTVAIDWNEFAAECVRVLQSRLRAPLEPFARVVLPIALVRRGSCGEPRADWGALPAFRGEATAQRWRVQSDRVQLRSEPVAAR